MARPVVHWEMWSENPEKASEFYQKVFDWEIRSLPEMDYHLMEPGEAGGIGGGIMKPQQGPWPAKLTLYIDVDDLDEYGSRITEAGGKILVDKQGVPGVGELSLFEDPDGRVLGLWKQGPRPA
jgi:predicted enzyme related to lactoylglutathione lyase